MTREIGIMYKHRNRLVEKLSKTSDNREVEKIRAKISMIDILLNEIKNH